MKKTRYEAWPYTRSQLELLLGRATTGAEWGALDAAAAAFDLEDQDHDAWLRFRCQVHTWVAEVLKESRGEK
jgi:hypothetical protein